MPRQRHGTVPLLTLDPELPTPLYRQLTDSLREAILSGRLAGGARLPSTRSLADDLRLSRSTVVAAFEQLTTEGYLESRVGSGTTVSVGLARTESDLPTDAPATSEADQDESSYILRPGIPALDEFASTAFGRILRRVFRQIGSEVPATGAASGDLHLSRAVARHLRGSRGVRCSEEQVVITSGSQEGLCLAFELIGDRGDDLWVENPGYFGATDAASVVGLRPRSVPVDTDGLVVPAGLRRWPNACGAYVTPSHQFPTGSLLSARRRAELLDWAHHQDAYVVEDDYDSEFHLEGRALPALQGMGHDDRVVYVGTFSKSLAPALRLGFVVLPSHLRDRAVRIKAARSGPQPVWLQRAAAIFIEEGHFARHVRRTRALYRARRDVLVDAVSEVLGDRATVRTPTGSMHALLDLRGDVDGSDLGARLAARGVGAVPLVRFGVPPDGITDAGLLIGFGGYDAAQIRTGVEAMASAWKPG